MPSLNEMKYYITPATFHYVFSAAEHGAQNIMGRELFKELGLIFDEPNQQFMCPQLNVSSCLVLDQEERLVFMIYNPKPFSSNVNVKLPVMDVQTIAIYDEEGNEIEFESIKIPEQVKEIPGRIGNANFEVFFEAQGIPALGKKLLLNCPPEVTRYFVIFLSPKRISLVLYRSKHNAKN